MDLSKGTQKSSKSYKLLKIKKRLPPDKNPKPTGSTEEEEEEEEETEHNFFKRTTSRKSRTSSYDEKVDIIPYETAGPTSAFSNKDQAPKNTPRKMTIRSTPQKFTITPIINYELRFKEALSRIDEAKKKTEKEDKMKMKLLSPRERVVVNRETHILQKYKSTAKYWKTIEKGLAGKSNKKASEVICTQWLDTKKTNEFSDAPARSCETVIQDKLRWYMSLRDDPKEGKTETFLRVGPELNGLYTRVRCNNEETSRGIPISPDAGVNCEELQIIGIGKLPLEIEAVKRVGYEFMKPELLVTEKWDEVIAEQYDKKLKAVNT